MRFVYDWFSHNIPSWDTYLKPLKGKRNVKMLEIGCFEGRATVWLLQNILTNQSSSITVIDTFLGSRENKQEKHDVGKLEKRFKRNISAWKNQVTIQKGFSYDWLRKYPAKPIFDFIYVDGSHIGKDVLEDAVLSWRLLKKGGILTFDDYRDWNYYADPIMCPRLAIDHFLEIYRNQYEIVYLDYQLALRKLGDNLIKSSERAKHTKLRAGA